MKQIKVREDNGQRFESSVVLKNSFLLLLKWTLGRILSYKEENKEIKANFGSLGCCTDFEFHTDELNGIYFVGEQNPDEYQ